MSNRDGNNEVYVMDPDGNNQIRLTDNPETDLPTGWKRRPEGDANCDGLANPVDAALILQLTAGH